MVTVGEAGEDDSWAEAGPKVVSSSSRFASLPSAALQRRLSCRLSVQDATSPLHWSFLFGRSVLVSSAAVLERPVVCFVPSTVVLGFPSLALSSSQLLLHIVRVRFPTRSSSAETEMD